MLHLMLTVNVNVPRRRCCNKADTSGTALRGRQAQGRAAAACCLPSAQARPSKFAPLHRICTYRTVCDSRRAGCRASGGVPEPSVDSADRREPSRTGTSMYPPYETETIRESWEVLMRWSKRRAHDRERRANTLHLTSKVRVTEATWPPCTPAHTPPAPPKPRKQNKNT
jgi:hypothetical protein